MTIEVSLRIFLCITLTNMMEGIWSQPIELSSYLIVDFLVLITMLK